MALSNRIQGGHETIIVVEDDEAVRNVASRILKKLGYKILMAQDGQEAMQIFETKSKEIDLAILDVVMPKESGPQVYKNMQKINPKLPVLFVTGYDIRAEIDKLGLLPKAPISILQKPYTKQSLSQEIRKLLDR